MKKIISNKNRAIIQKKNYSNWKQDSLDNNGFFVIFNGFLEKDYLRKISGGALKLYVYLGINSHNTTGESFYKLTSIANYFNVSERTISNWFKELLKLRLIERYQLELNGVSHTYLNVYDAGERRMTKSKK
ncbi:helix-turn-helix domain-containing protein [Mammaliicoccus sciuri]|uniref:helix-turn-helix domain-containing protein n=1 Tax=Mammaliicoccus sciuri TaxID=1296 RepID=UPI001FB3589C|nr:helix-turn-helix domain-containing protein [Mammaliicoccus sciuri]MCJ1750299.1 helix-turn-helix domain-containing protein [Mammaliicoccus sciuri]